jgi:hypothetical protein
MKRRTGFIAGALAAGLAAAAGLGGVPARPVHGAAGPHGTADELLDARRFAYLEDERALPRRALAEIGVELRRAEDGRARLAIRASATGPLVAPPPGWRERSGANRITARELERLHGEGAIALRSTRIGGAPAAPRVSVAGSVRAGRRGPLARRRALPGGRFALAADDGGAHLLALELASGGLAEGRWRTEVEVEGEPRLWVEIEWGGARGRILGAGSLGAHALAPAVSSWSP